MALIGIHLPPKCLKSPKTLAVSSLCVDFIHTYIHIHTHTHLAPVYICNIHILLQGRDCVLSCYLSLRQPGLGRGFGCGKDISVPSYSIISQVPFSVWGVPFGSDAAHECSCFSNTLACLGVMTYRVISVRMCRLASPAAGAVLALLYMCVLCRYICLLFSFMPFKDAKMALN